MRIPKHYTGLALATFGAGLLLSCLIPPFILVCLLAIVITATGVILWK